MPISRKLGRLAAGVAIVSVAGSGALASAQLPGVTPGKTVVIVDDTTVQVAVDAPNLVPATVGVGLQNNSNSAIPCDGLKGKKEGGPKTRGGTITTSEIVARTVSFYTKYPHAYDDVMPVELTGAFVGGTQIFVGTGSVTDFVPGSLTGALRPEFGEAGRLNELYTQARVNGLVGAVNSATIPANSGTTLTVPLGVSSTGVRPLDFRPAAVIACQRGNQDFLYSGYYGDQTPSIPLGSIASSETGRFGS